MSFLDSLDIANRACQHVGVGQIQSIDEDSRQNYEIAFAYDKLREAELRRNTWRFAIRRAALRAIQATTLKLVPNLWSATTLYTPGAVVADANGDLWSSLTPENLNNIPGQSPAWDQYFGALTVDAWSATASYFAGDLVYVVGGNPGAYVVYMSLANSNTDVPGTAEAWDAAITYSIDDTVSYGGDQWRSLLAFNLNVTPAVGPALWDTAISYGTGEAVTADDGYIYESIGENNMGNSPPEDGGVNWTATNVPNAWTKTPAIYPAANTWLPLYASLEPFIFLSPLGFSSPNQARRNIFRLPANYLRTAPQDPKAGATSALGAPSGNAYNDWEFEGDYLISADAGPIMFRFVADVNIVSKMDAMFCEGLGARIGLEVCEPLTQSNAKINTIASAYQKFMSEARAVNAIETGSVEPPEDDWITCRA